MATKVENQDVIAVLQDTLLEVFIGRTGDTIYDDELAPGLEIGHDKHDGSVRSFLIPGFLSNPVGLIRAMDQLGNVALSPRYTLTTVKHHGRETRLHVPGLSLKDIVEYVWANFAPASAVPSQMGAHVLAEPHTPYTAPPSPKSE
jgi:hypothetical protein